jgi:hypothetical protein
VFDIYQLLIPRCWPVHLVTSLNLHGLTS